ncbi:hypothetical protein ACJDU8_06915 [Clostridium sp. WILCCON 0269]|uniref:Uncharacterized protein n=1 Tax=Candidatus Clostridium eludens TaxID=3381663 RepID=A0ABW8SHP0_9CLOT
MQQYSNHAINLLNSHNTLIGVVFIWCAAFANRIGKVKVCSIIDMIIKFREHSSKLKNEKLDRELKKIQIEEEKLKLEEQRAKLMKYQEEISSSASNLEINSDNAKNIIDFNKYHQKDDK